MIDRDTVDALRIAGLWKRGIPPEAGGYMDQTESIVDACEQIWAEQQHWKNELKVPDLGD